MRPDTNEAPLRVASYDPRSTVTEMVTGSSYTAPSVTPPMVMTGGVAVGVDPPSPHASAASASAVTAR